MRIGLIVNPVAGVGGPFALRGSDGDRARKAIEAGAVPLAGGRAGLALSGFGGTVVTAAGAMGEDAARGAGLSPQIAYEPRNPSTAADTVGAAQAIIAGGIDLLVFAGGDGTARDLLAVVGDKVPVIGVPAGVKMHSAVFGVTPRAVAEVIASAHPATRHGDVIDRGQDGHPVLFGRMRTPVSRGLVQAAKASRRLDADADLAAAVSAMAADVRTMPLAFIGCGTTMLAVKDLLGGGGTLLGIDAYAHGVPFAADADEARLWALAGDTVPQLVLGVVGGQGFLLGRGNQQLSPRLIRRIGRANIHVLASFAKLAAFEFARLAVDTGDPGLDAELAGHIKVNTGHRRAAIMRI